MRRALCTLLLLLLWHVRESVAERRILTGPFRRAIEDGGDIRRRTLANTTVAPINTAAASGNETPPNTTAAPRNTTVAPISATDAPISATGAPISATDAPISATGAPISATGAPISAIGVPINTAAASGNETLSNTTAAPTNAIEGPVNTTVPPTNPTEVGINSSATGADNASTNATEAPKNASAPGEEATPTKTAAPGSPWLAVSEGSPCTVFTGSRYSCAETGNFPKEYGKNETCKFQVLKAGQITARPFRTERKFDVLYIDNEQFSGEVGPHHVNVEIGANVTWHSDASVVHAGFEFCLGQDTHNDGFLISANSHCETSTEKSDENENPCVQTRGYPNNYEDGRECFIRTEKEGYIYAVDFKTEPVFDVLSIGELGDNPDFSGDTKPESVQVAANTKVRWKSDNRFSEAGWKICLSSKPMPTSAPATSTSGPSVAPESKKPDVDITASAVTENVSLYSVRVISRSVDDFTVSIRATTRERADVACLVQQATHGVPTSLFDVESQELKHVTVYPDMPEGSGLIKFTETVDGFPLSSSQYRLSCRGPDLRIGTSVITLKKVAKTAATEQDSKEHKNEPSSFLRYVMWAAFAIAIIVCGVRSVKKCRAGNGVTQIDYEMTSPSNTRGPTRKGGYVPPTMVGYSGMV